MDNFHENIVPNGSVWQHIKTGNIYCVVGGCFIESTHQRAVLYQKPTDRLPWARPLSEFLDGRFKRVTALDRSE